MSDSSSTAVAPLTPAAESPAVVDKRKWAEDVLTEILRLLEIRARLEFKDAADLGIAVAVHLEAENPGLGTGRRTPWVDALQFLTNKIVNRPNTERRWISIGLGAFPEPRPPSAMEDRPPFTPVSLPSTPSPKIAASAAVPKARRPPPPVVVADVDERTMEIPADPVMSGLGKLMAEKSAKYGRYFAAVALSQADRARLVQGAQGTLGSSVRAEGEGRNRRVVFTPEKPVPMPKRALPQDDDDEEFLEE